jgi:hypothetical protein
MSFGKSVVRRSFGSLVLVLAVQSAASAVSWTDDFNDGSVTDGNPVTWLQDPGSLFPGTYDATSGDYKLTDPNGPFNQMITWVQSPSFGEVHIRTQGTILPGALEGQDQGNLAILARLDAATLSGYVLYFDTDFNLGALVLQGGGTLVDESVDLGDGRFNDDKIIDGADFIQWQREFPDTRSANNLTEWETNFGWASFSPFGTEVNLQFDIVGNQLSGTVWEVGTPQPAPQFTYTDPDNTYTTGAVGLGYDDDSEDTTGVYRFFTVQDTPFASAVGAASAVPEPTSLALAVGLGCVLATRRHRGRAAR